MAAGGPHEFVVCVAANDNNFGAPAGTPMFAWSPTHCWGAMGYYMSRAALLRLDCCYMVWKASAAELAEHARRQSAAIGCEAREQRAALRRDTVQ
jgi:hypothetical protein